MPVDTSGEQKQKLLSKLRKAGPAGLTKGKLGVKQAKGKAAQALSELMAERKVANLGTATRTIYVLIEHFNPLERAYDKIEKNALSKKQARADTIELLIKRDLEKGCEGEVRKKVDEAVDWLLKENSLIKLCRGRTVYYVHVERFRCLDSNHQQKSILEQIPQVSNAVTPLSKELKWDDVMDAYRQVKQRLGYSSIPIYDLQQKLESPMDMVKRFLVEEARQGRAFLSVGDWSLSSEDVRSGVIELGGYRYLLVRFNA
jgi:hypothetical protein